MQEVHGHVYYCHHIFDENDDMSEAKVSSSLMQTYKQLLVKMKRNKQEAEEEN